MHARCLVLATSALAIHLAGCSPAAVDDVDDSTSHLEENGAESAAHPYLRVDGWTRDGYGLVPTFSVHQDGVGALSGIPAHSRVSIMLPAERCAEAYEAMDPDFEERTGLAPTCRFRINVASGGMGTDGAKLLAAYSGPVDSGTLATKGEPMWTRELDVDAEADAVELEFAIFGDRGSRPFMKLPIGDTYRIPVQAKPRVTPE